jgi:hypothetical protein
MNVESCGLCLLAATTPVFIWRAEKTMEKLDQESSSSINPRKSQSREFVSQKSMGRSIRKVRLLEIHGKSNQESFLIEIH